MGRSRADGDTLANRLIHQPDKPVGVNFDALSDLIGVYEDGAIDADQSPGIHVFSVN